jgi:hypothetical protein
VNSLVNAATTSNLQNQLYLYKNFFAVLAWMLIAGSGIIGSDLFIDKSSGKLSAYNTKALLNKSR